MVQKVVDLVSSGSDLDGVGVWGAGCGTSAGVTVGLKFGAIQQRVDERATRGKPIGRVFCQRGR